MACDCTTPCNETLLGCTHYHTTECVTGNGIIGNQPNGTSLTNILNNFWTYFQNNLADDGISITGATVNGSGFLIITLSNGSTINAGYVLGTNGTNGTDGTNGIDGIDGTDGADGAAGTNGVGISTITTNGSGDTIITYTDATVINLGNVSPKIFFGSNYDNPNDATVGHPLLDYNGVVIYNTTTVIPITFTGYFNTVTKELWTWDGTNWDNPMSIGNHLEAADFSLNYNSVASPSTTLIKQYTPTKVLEDGERYRVKLSGDIYDNVGLKIDVTDGTITQNVCTVIVNNPLGDSKKQYYSVIFDTIRKSSTTYVTSISGCIQQTNIASLPLPSGGSAPFIRTITTGTMNTNIVPNINITGVSGTGSPIQSNAITIEEFSVEKIKY